MGGHGRHCTANHFLSFSMFLRLSVGRSDGRLTPWSSFRRFSCDPRQHPQNPFWDCEEGMGTCECVCVHPSPLSLSRSIPIEHVPALCVCWLTGLKERQLFSMYPETLPCQVWDEILSMVLTPHSRASRSKTHTIAAPGLEGDTTLKVGQIHRRQKKGEQDNKLCFLKYSCQKCHRKHQISLSYTC